MIVNRLWHHHFGRGIVATLENFGKMGEQPTHPELLDWLAVEFMKRGWSMKQIHRLMMTSEAYQMASAFEDAGNVATATGEPVLVAIQRAQRLEAEIVRDSILAGGGNINLEIGGEPIFPLHRPPRFSRVRTSRRSGRTAGGSGDLAAQRLRLSTARVAVSDVRTVRPSGHESSRPAARNVSTVPTQALTLLNNAFVLSQAKRLADRVRTAAERSVCAGRRRRINLRWRRPATEGESRVGVDLITKQSPDVVHSRAVLNLNEFIYMR